MHIAEHGRITRKTVMELLGIGRTKADEILSNMFGDGLIVRKGAGRGTHYVLLVQIETENDK